MVPRIQTGKEGVRKDGVDMSKVIDGWIVLAVILTLIAAVPLALIGFMYGVILLTIFAVVLSPLALVFGLQALWHRWVRE